MQRQYNLDDPWLFAGDYLKSIIFECDFGPSLQYRDQRVNDLLATSFPISATIGLAALVLAVVAGVYIGISMTITPASLLSAIGMILILVGVSLPAFVTGSILLTLWINIFHRAPVGVWEWPGWSVVSMEWWTGVLSFLKHILLPVVTLSAAPAAYITRLVHLRLSEVLASDFIRTAKAKGLSPSRVVYSHAIKIVCLPVVSFLGPAAAITMTGSFIVERIFAIPGMGEHFVNAVLNKDQFLILGVVLIYSMMLICFNLAADVIYILLDPRIEYRDPK